MSDTALEAATMRRVGRRLIPLLFCLYIVCFIDRTNVSVAALQMNRDLAFSAAVYGLGAGIFFLGYALFEVPSNLILARVGARRWIGRIAITDQGIGWILGLIGAAGAGAMLLIGASSDRGGDRIRHAAGAMGIAAIGCAVAAFSQEPVVTVAGIAVAVVGTTAFLPVFWCIPSTILRGTAAAGGIALINSIGNAGGFFGPNLLGQVKDATGSFSGGFLALAVLTLAGAGLTLRLRHRLDR
jgi:nitrate/nitrite transporter NarK